MALDELLKSQGYQKDTVPIAEQDVKPSFLPDDGDGWEEVESSPSMAPSPILAAKETPALLKNTKYAPAEEQKKVEDLLRSKGDVGFNTAMQLSGGDLAQSLMTYYDVDPDTAAFIDQASKNQGITFDHALTSPEWQQKEKAERVLKMLTERKEDGTYVSPYTARWVSNPKQMALVKEDVDVFMQLEADMISQYGSLYENVAKNTSDKIKEMSKYMISSAQSLVKGATAVGTPPDLESGHQVYTDPYQATAGLLSLLGQQEALEGVEPGEGSINKKFEEMIASELLEYVPLPDVGGAKQLFLDATGMGVQVLGAVTGSVLTGGSPVGATMFMAPYIFGSTKESLMEQGVAEDRAEVAGFFNAIAQAPLEAIGFGKLFNMFKAGGFRQFLANWAEAVGTEFSTEFIQALPESAAQIWGKAALGGKTFPEQVEQFGKDLPETLYSGAYEGVVAALMTMFLGGFKLPSAAYKSVKSQSDLEKYDKIMATAETSVSKDKAKGSMEGFLSTVSEDENAPDTIRVNVDPILEYFQEDPEGLKKFVDTLGVADQMTEAQATGKELEVSIPKWVTEMSGTDVATALRDHIRMAEDGFTQNELNVFGETISKQVEADRLRIQDFAADKVRPPQIEVMRYQLMNQEAVLSLSTAAADVDAHLEVFTAAGKVLSRKAGESYQEWVDRINPSLIIGGQYVSGQGLTQGGLDLVKIKEFSTEEGSFSAYDLTEEAPKDRANIATVYESEEGWIVRNILVPEDMQRKGVASNFYKKMNIESLKQTGKPLRSTQPRKLVSGDVVHELSEDGIALWDSFVKDGIAEKLGEKDYQMKTQTQLFQQSAEDTNLLVVHNTTANKLAQANKLGGLAVPSVAVVNKNFPMENFGEITLIANKRLIDPKEDRAAKTFNADVYSPRFPTTEPKLNLKALRSYESKVDAIAKKYTDDVIRPKPSIYTFEADLKDDSRNVLYNDVLRLLFIESRTAKVKTSSAVDRYISKNRGEFEEFIDDFMEEVVEEERIFTGFSYSGNRQYKKLTLDNVVRLLKKELRGGEGFNYGVPSIRAKVAKKFKSIKDIKKSEKSLVSAAEMEAVKEEFDRKFNDLYDEFTPYLKHKPEGFGAFDAFSEHIQEGIDVGFRTVAETYYEDLPDSAIQHAVEFLEELRTAPTEYFESKIQRAVGINEFTVAIVPDNTSTKTFKLLKDNGIEARVYKQKDPTARGKAIRALEQEQPDLFFQDPTEPKASVQFTDGATLINLFKTANMSSLLHEFGHIFVNDMQNLINSGKADEQLAKDLDTLLEFADGKFDRAGLEKIAKGFETYLREGKTPSLKLASAFSRFKQWLTAIYKTARGTGVEISDEVRQVFDRMLATEEEIKEAQAHYKSVDSLTKFLDTSKKQKTEIATKKAKADQSTLDKQANKTLSVYLDLTGGKKAIREHATTEIDESPLYKTIADVTAEGSFNADDIETAYGPEAVKTLKTLNKKMVKKKGKVAVSVMAVKYEYESEQDLMNALLAAEPRGKAINARAKGILTEKEKLVKEWLTRDETVSGDEAIHNDDQFNLLLAEAKVLSDKAKTEQSRRLLNLEAKAYVDAAEQHINSLPVSRATRYDQWARTEARYAKLAYEAAQSGDIESAAKYKQKQLINHALVQSAIRARDEKVKIEKRYSAKSITSKLKNVEDSYREVVLDLVASYGLSNSPKIAPQRPESVPKLDSLDDTLSDITPEWILTKQRPDGFKGWKDMSMHQVRELDQAIKSIMKYGSNDLLTMKEAGFKTIEELKDASVAAAENIPNRPHAFKEGSIRASVDGLLSSLVMAEFEFERLDGYSMSKNKTFGPLRKLFNVGVESEVKWNDMKQEVFDSAQTHWDGINKAVKRIQKSYGLKQFDIEGVPVIDAQKNVSRDKWTAEQLVAFALNRGNESNIEAMDNAYGYTENQVNTILSHFTETELNAIQGIWDSTDLLFKRLDEAHFRVYNKHVAKVDPQELKVTTNDGKEITLKGGYYPLQFDHLLNDIADAYNIEKRTKEILANRNANVLRSTSPEKGMTFSRTEGHSLPPELSLSVWFTHIADTARYISHTEYMRDLNRLTLNPEWRSMVRSKSGRKTYEKIRGWVEYQARPERRLTNDWEKKIDNQRKLATIAILGLNIPVGLKQRLSMFSAAEEIGWKWIMNGYVNNDVQSSILGLSSSQQWANVIKTSGYMRTRVGNIDRELSDLRKKMNPIVKKFEIQGHEFTWRDVQDFMMEWIQMNDRATVGVVWMGSFNKFSHENMDMSEDARIKAAVTYADSIVRTTQPSTLPTDLNELQRSDGWLRLFTSFATWMFKAGNRTYFKTRALKEGAITPRDYMRFGMYEMLMAPWGAAIISSLWVTGDLPEWYQYITAPIENLVAWIPYLRDVAGAIKYRSAVGQSVAFEGVNRIVKAAWTTANAAAGDKAWMDAVWDIGKAIEVQAGVPALKFTTDVARAVKHITEE